MNTAAKLPYDFKSLKEKVGVTDVASALGYVIDRKAGVGRYVEMVRLQDGQKTDTLVIRNPNDRAAQTYFRRDGSKGDAITLIRDHLAEFNVSLTGNEWKNINAVMLSLAGSPGILSSDRQVLESAKEAREFNTLRYKVESFTAKNRMPHILAERGFSEDTFRTFADKMKMVTDLNIEKFSGYNVGFPYTSDGENITGYEMRGRGGFKSKAHGTNSTDAAWVADFSGGMPGTVKDVYFFESAFDAMAFYQHNAVTLNNVLDKSVFVSVGGQLSNRQVQNILDRYPHAVVHDCFDNDISGRLYGIRTALLASGINARVAKHDSRITVTTSDRMFTLDENAATLSGLRKELKISDRIVSSNAPAGFKDWNDVILGRRMTESASPSKHLRDRELELRRNSPAMKM